jgi:hypothetical protein
MATNIDAKLAQMKQIAEPVKPEPPIKTEYGGIFLATSFDAIGAAYKNYEMNSVRNFEAAQNEIAQTALNATDFQKRIDTEVNPQYKNMLMMSSAHRQVFKQQELIAKGITDREFKNNRDLYTSLQFENMANARETNASYSDWLGQANEMRGKIVEKYGSLPANFETNFEQMKKKSSESYLRGEMSKIQSNYVESSTQNFVRKQYTAEEALSFFKNDIVDKIQNPDDPNQNWVNEAYGSVVSLIKGAKNLGVANEIISGLREYISPDQAQILKNVAVDAIAERNQVGTELLKKNYEYVEKHHQVGLAVPDSMVFVESQRITNDYIKSHDFAHISSQRIDELAEEAPTFEIYDMLQEIKKNIKNDFENDFLTAIQKRNPFDTFASVTAPSVAENDIVDNEGNQLAKKGELIGMDEFLRSVDKRGVLAQTAQITYGRENVQHRFGVEEAQQISGVRDSLDTFEKRTRFDRELLKHLKDVKVSDPFTEFSHATGDIAAASVYRQMDNPPGITGGSTTILRNFHNYDSMRRNNPKEFAQRTQIVNDILMYPVSTNTESRVLPDVIDQDLRLFLQTNAIGSTYNVEEPDAISEKINSEYNFWTRQESLFTPDGAEPTDVQFLDFWEGTAKFTDLMTQTIPSTAQRTASVFASKRDYSMFKKSLANKKFDYGMKKNIDSKINVGAGYVAMRGVMPFETTGEIEFKTRISLGERTIQDILSTNKNLTIKNHNSSLKEFVIIEYKDNNDFDYALDNVGNPMIFTID